MKQRLPDANFGPVKRHELIKILKKYGFECPYSGGNHQYMIKNKIKLFIPNPHKGDISRAFLGKILQQAGLEREEWESL